MSVIKLHFNCSLWMKYLLIGTKLVPCCAIYIKIQVSNQVSFCPNVAHKVRLVHPKMEIKLYAYHGTLKRILLIHIIYLFSQENLTILLFSSGEVSARTLVDWQSDALESARLFLPFCTDFTGTCSLLISYPWELRIEHLHWLQGGFWELRYEWWDIKKWFFNLEQGKEFT